MEANNEFYETNNVKMRNFFDNQYLEGGFHEDEPTLDEEQILEYFNKAPCTFKRESSTLLDEVIIESNILDQSHVIDEDELNSTQLSLFESSISQEKSHKLPKKTRKTMAIVDENSEEVPKRRRGRPSKSLAPNDLETSVLKVATKKKLVPENQPTLDSYFKEHKSTKKHEEVVSKKVKLNYDKENVITSQDERAKRLLSRRTNTFRKYNSADSALIATRASTRIKETHASIKIITTGILLNDKQQCLIKSLHGQIVLDVKEATHLITNGVIKSWKFMACLNRGIPIVSTSYLDASKRAHMFLAPNNYQLIDIKAEKNFKFSLESSLTKARSSPLLHGWNFILNCKGTNEISLASLKNIIECGNGQVVDTYDKTSTKKHVFLFDSERELVNSQMLCVKVLKMTTDWFFTCVLRQNFP